MKQILILIAAIIALVACVKEEPVSEVAIPVVPEDYLLSFSIQESAPVTRASVSDETQGSVIDLGMTEDGMPLRFVDQVSRIGLPSGNPLTKGAPATSENVGSLYGSFSAMAYDDKGNEINLDNKKSDNSLLFTYKAATYGGKWSHVFNTDPWINYSSLYFLAYMPLLPSGAELKPKDKTISFSYTVPANPSDQKDLLFGGATITKAAYESNSNSATLSFCHALSGVKFAIGNDANSTVIKSVSLTGIKNSGSVVIAPETPSVVWSSVTGSASYTVNVPGVTEIASVKNLNESDLSLTLWLIPQTLSNDAELSVTYTVNGGTERTVSAKINAALGSPLSLNAGELHTFTLNPDDVNVNVTDDVAASGLSNVVITNTGNISAYLRAVIVANWQDADGNIVAAWDFEASEFEGLPGAGWILGADGYYYTDGTIAPGADAPALFTTYTPPSAPVAGAHLVMDIAVQAVQTKSGSWTD